MITLVAALTKERIIGKDGRLPWSIPDDLENFREMTEGGTLIMGRKTFESIGRPLPARRNIVLSRTMKPVPGIEVCRSVEEALVKTDSDAFIIGGGEVFRQTIGLADRMFLSHIKKEHDGDTRFPVFDPDDWVPEERTDHPDFEFVVYRRKGISG